MVSVALFAVSGCDKTETSPRQYILNFAGEGVNVESQSVIHRNYAIEPENPEREGYGFGGWFTDNDTFVNKWDFTTNIVTQDTTLYAKWEENTLPETNLQGTKWKLIAQGYYDRSNNNVAVINSVDIWHCIEFLLNNKMKRLYLSSNGEIIEREFPYQIEEQFLYENYIDEVNAFVYKYELDYDNLTLTYVQGNIEDIYPQIVIHIYQQLKE